MIPPTTTLIPRNGAHPGHLRRNRWMVVCLAIASAFALAAATSAILDNKSASEIRQIRLSTSNAFLYKSGGRNILIDTGQKSDLAALTAGLAAEGVALEKITTVVLTHAHHDHAGLAAEVKRRSGAHVIAGAGDSGMAQAGHDDELKPTGLMARILKRFVIDPTYEGFAVDMQVDAHLDLRPFGIPGRAIQMPGHTAGSLVVIFDDGRAVVGDIMLGGWLGGAIFANSPGEHYFQADQARNRANIIELLKQGIHTFYLGHGGPVTRAAVLNGFGLADK